jgi:transmembrane sensor
MSVSAPENRTSAAQEAADWYVRLRSDSVSEVEEARFRAWLSGDPARRREFDELSDLWDKLSGVAQSPEVLRELSRADRVPTAIVGTTTTTAVAPPRTSSRRAVVGWALAAGVAGVAGFLSWQHLFSSDTYSTGLGELSTVSLADGSVLTLNTSSRVQVKFSGSERRVNVLQGQANFEVAKDASRPFIVSAGTGHVRALGTSFDVYQRDDDVVVTLIEGRVAVSPDASTGTRSEVTLGPGDQVIYDGQDDVLQRTTVDLRRVTAWHARKLDFTDTPLRDAIAEANRYSHKKIELRAPDLAGATLSGVFDAGQNEALADGLRAYFGLHIEHVGEDLIVLTQGAH